MNFTLPVYQMLESRFFNSLTKKLGGNFLFLTLLQVLIGIILWDNIDKLQSLANASELLGQATEIDRVTSMLWLCFWLCFF